MKNKHLMLYPIMCSFLIISCNTTESSSPKNKEQHKVIIDLREQVQQLNDQISALQEENDENKKTNAIIENSYQSQREEIATLKKNIEILKRGIRSGIFEEFPEDTKETDSTAPHKTMLPDFTYGRTGFSETSEDLRTLPLSSKRKNEEAVGPKELLANAELKIRKSDFKMGLIQLDEFKKNFPNFDDKGRSFLLSAEAWINLREFNNALPEIRSFYLKYPTSPELAYAKLLEAQAFEGNESFEKAANLYNEVIYLSPQSKYAKSARESMQRMRDRK